MKKQGKDTGPSNGEALALVCASCPNEYQDEVSMVCKNLGIQKAFGRAGDMLDTLSGKEWLGKWEAKVVMAVVTKAHTLKTRRARIICVSGGPHCDLEVAQQPKLVRAIKLEAGDEAFSVKVEWMEISEFREDYSAGYDSVVRNTMALAKKANGNAGAAKHVGKQPVGQDTKVVKQPSKNVDGKQAGGEGKGKPAKKTSGDAADHAADSKEARGGANQQGGAVTTNQPGQGPQGKSWGCKQCGKQFPANPALVQHQSSTGHAGITTGMPRADAKRPPLAKAEPPPAEVHDTFVCGECEKEFSSETAFDQHQTATGHSDPSCSCGKSFGSFRALQQHLDSTGHRPVPLRFFEGVPSVGAAAAGALAAVACGAALFGLSMAVQDANDKEEEKRLKR